ncbi:metalloprotease TldD [Sphingomonas carotinifaciens]|nr:metalloprotease TldD [Sphingomonas carotinifaciens]
MAALTPLDVAEQRLLAPNDLTREAVGSALENLIGNGADYADLYFETGHAENWRLTNGSVSAAAYSISEGFGARSVTGDQTAFAYSGAISPQSIAAATSSVRSMRLHGNDAARTGGVEVRALGSPSLIYPMEDPLETLGAAEKIALLKDLDERSRAVDSRIVRISAELQASHSTILIAGSDGTLAGDARPQVQLILSVLAQEGNRRASGSATAGGRHLLSDFTGEMLDRLIATATRIALTNLDARPAPSGMMPVVLGNGFPGILLHEAVGHGLEGDAHRKRSSVFIDRMGDRIAASSVTVIDDGTLPCLRGSLAIDDEGTPSSRNVLIEDGRLVGLMQDRTSGRLLNQRLTGNARRDGYDRLPMPRMTNTFLAAGDYDPAEIVASVKHGIYAADFGGGQVDITSGQFNFSAVEAYLIEDGKITAPISGAVLIGLGHEALKNVSMVGNNLAMANGVCGKEGQTIPVCVGQPTVRIDEMVIGGTA